MSIIDLFGFVLENYNGSSEEYKQSSRVVKVNLPEKIKASIGVNKYIIKGSVGVGNKAETPWVAIMNPAITNTTQKGYYVVYLLDCKQQTVYLSLAVGWTQFADNFSFKEASDRIHKYSKYLLTQLHDKPPGFIDGPIDLSAKGDLTRGYEIGQILSKKYRINDLLDEKEMYDDILSIINVYDGLASIAGNDLNNIDYDFVTNNKKLGNLDIEINRITLEKDYDSIRRQLLNLTNTQPTSKRETIIRKAIRNPKIARLVKENVDYICEICNREPFTQKNGTPYAEADHIRPLGGVHNGIDSPDNMRCLCAQCHAVVTHGSEMEIRKILKI